MTADASMDVEEAQAFVLSEDPDGQIALDLHRSPREDAGAPTQGNFHYQTEVIASFCFGMPSNAAITKIICEWDEDFIIVRNRPPLLELVQVKHHDRALYTTMKMLCDEGGLAHLFDRWLGYTSGPAARLCSNTKLGGRPGEASPRALHDACRMGALTTPAGSPLLAHLAWAMLDVARSANNLVFLPKPTAPSPTKQHRHDPAALPPGLFDLLLRFMTSLRFDCDRPAKNHIEDVNVRQLVEPTMARLGFSKAIAPTAYKAIIEIIAEASRDRSGRPPDLARYLTEPGAYEPTSELAQTVERRTVSREAVLDAIRHGANRTSGGAVSLLRSGQAPPRAAGGHRLTEKMSLALIDEAEQENALRLRDLWLHVWPQARTGFPEDIETEYRLELEILDIVRNVRQMMIGKSDPYGVQFQALLHQHLRQARLSSKVNVPLDDFHILGLAYELSDLCKFGFSRPAGEQ